jgi:hypothetical protein
MSPAVIEPTTLRWPTAANPIEAMQPHREQSGLPPTDRVRREFEVCRQRVCGARKNASLR